MTIDRLHLAELIEKGSDADLLREMMTFVVNRMMDLEVESLTGAGYGERSADRTNQRNGYRERPWHTTLGTLPVAIPRLVLAPAKKCMRTTGLEMRSGASAFRVG